MSNHSATYDFELFSVQESNGGEDEGARFSIQVLNGVYLMIVASTKKLTYTRTPSERSSFKLEPVPATTEGVTANNTFHILFNGEPLVSYQAAPPIEFYLQSRYPTERPATFHVTRRIDVARAYRGRRENILRIAKHVHNFREDDESKLEGYTELVDLMRNSSHISGEIGRAHV